MVQPVHDKMKALFNEVSSNPAAEILTVDQNLRSLDEKRIERRVQMLKEDFGYSLPPSVWDMVLFPDVVSLCWKVKGSDDPELIGEFHLENVINAVHLNISRIPLDRADITDETRALFTRARYFDAQPTQDWYVATVLMLEEKKAFPDLWFLDHDGIYRMNIGIEDYFDALVLTKGMYYWQYLYCEPDAFRAAPDYRKRYVHSMMDILPALFPEHDYAPLRNRYQAGEQ